MKVAILGSTGMLGSMVRRVLAERSEYELTCPSHDDVFAETAHPTHLLDLIRGCAYAINCIGVIKPRIDENNPASVRDAIQVNAVFPHHLAHAAGWAKCKVLQIATDCVFSGATGGYTESSSHDALDVYGKTKSLGEVRSPNVHHLRCSIIGPELEGRKKDSLLEWFLGQPQGATVQGYVNHRWNGVTTLAFANICHGIMFEGIELPLVQHIVPAGIATKAELLRLFAQFYNRLDVHIEDREGPTWIERTLSTSSLTPAWAKLWKAAGYKLPPTVEEMIEELAAYK